MQREPGREGEPVAEAGVDRVLEVRVRVDEAGDDRRVVEALALAELVAGPTAAMRPSSTRTAPSRIGGPSTGSTQSAESDQLDVDSAGRPEVVAPPAARSQRRSITRRASQIESSNRITQRDRLEGERDRVDRRQQDRDDDDEEDARCGGSCAAAPT